jgi:hypothetical protein
MFRPRGTTREQLLYPATEGENPRDRAMSGACASVMTRASFARWVEKDPGSRACAVQLW